MEIMLGGLSWFILAFLSHLVVWRIRVPEQPFKMLFWMFLFFAVAGFLLLGLVPKSPLLEKLLPVTVIELAHTELLFLCLAVSYMFFYQGLKTKSASISMVMMVEKAGNKGVDRSAFNDLISDDKLIKPRIRFLAKTDMAHVHEGKYRLTTKGKLFARSFSWYRRLLKLSAYGG